MVWFPVFTWSVWLLNFFTGKMLSPHDERQDWKTLEDFGYQFNEKGELRDISTNGSFEFNLYENPSLNQWRYEKLGEIVEKHIYKLLEEDTKLLKVTIPVDHDNKEGKGFIFRSKNSFTCDKLLLVIHGSGVVRAGQWSRKLIINHSLESGTQIPYIRKAEKLGFGVLVLNSNQNYDDENGKRIRGSSSPEDHFIYVWNEFVSKSAARHVAIVAHSYGGVITTTGASFLPEVIEKTFAVAFTDSVHFKVKSSSYQELFSSWMEELGKSTMDEYSNIEYYMMRFFIYLHQNVCNWVSSSKDLDEIVAYQRGDCPRVSAGTRVHEETSWKAFNSVWSFIEGQWERVKGEDMDTRSVPVANIQGESLAGEADSNEIDSIPCDNNVQFESYVTNEITNGEMEVNQINELFAEGRKIVGNEPILLRSAGKEQGSIKVGKELHSSGEVTQPGVVFDVNSDESNDQLNEEMIVESRDGEGKVPCKKNRKYENSETVENRDADNVRSSATINLSSTDHAEL